MQKSAAEFFTEHQQIAGFDNPGKSLFTSIRELVENSLDAAESIQVLPEIKLSITEYTEEEHNELHGIKTKGKKKKASAQDADTSMDSTEGGSQFPDSQMTAQTEVSAMSESQTSTAKAGAKGKGAKGKKGAAVKAEKGQMYYKVSCEDNGCGIPEENIGKMLGTVLSGSKHGVRQTRGKFGLGAKMALIWSKKSSGLPINVRTAHATSAEARPSPIIDVVLDMDIYRNQPKTLSRESTKNTEQWRGTEIVITIGGNWTTYRSRTLQYFQQLAVITPYAKLEVNFECTRDPSKSFTASFARRSEQMPRCVIGWFIFIRLYLRMI